MALTFSFTTSIEAVSLFTVSQPVADRFGGLHDPVRRLFGCLDHRLQLQSAIAGRRARGRDDAGDLLADRGKLFRQVDFAEVDHLDGGMNFRAEFGDAAIEKGTQTVHFIADRRRDSLLDLACLVRHCARLMPKTGHFQPILVNIQLNAPLARGTFSQRPVVPREMSDGCVADMRCGEPTASVRAR